MAECPGRVAAQGSKNKGRGGRFYEGSRHLKPWRASVIKRIEKALERSMTWDRALPAVRVEILFVFARPASHFRTGRFATILRDDAPHYYPHSPDIDKCARAILDALTQSGAIIDDRVVVELECAQVYEHGHYRPGAVIDLTPVPLQAAAL